MRQAYDMPMNEPTTTPPERIWHVDGILAPFDKSTTLDGSRVTYATTPTAAAEKVLTACRKMRGEDWGWLGLVRVHPHYAWDDPDCPVCKRRASKKYPEAIDSLYEPVTITPHALTDEQAGYDVPSEVALAFAERVQRACLLDVNLYDLLQHDVARLLDEYAMEAVAAREAEIVAALEELRAWHENQAKRFENRDHNYSRTATASSHAYTTAANIVRKQKM